MSIFLDALYFSVVFGEDVAFGGVFRCTVGLRDKYGMIAIHALSIAKMLTHCYCEYI